MGFGGSRARIYLDGFAIIVAVFRASVGAVNGDVVRRLFGCQLGPARSALAHGDTE